MVKTSRLLLSVIVIILCNYIGSFLFHRFDLTSEKRYTLSPESVRLAENLKGTAFFKVYLEGKLPSGFVRLRDETKEMLDEFRAYSHGKLQYEFVNPSANPNPDERDAFYKQLENEGLAPVNLEVADNGASSQQIIFPGAILSYRGRDMPMEILQNTSAADPLASVNYSIEQLEYDIDNTIHKLSINLKPKVAFIEGQGEVDSIHTASITASLLEYYDVRRITLHHHLKILDDFKTIIIAKPDTSFDDRDAFIIDRFIMRGNSVLWLINPIEAPADSLQRNGFTLAFPIHLNLEDQLFHYGVRLNTNLVMDLQCSMIPQNVAYPGEPKRWKLFPWFYSPLVASSSDNPIVKNLNFIQFNLASTIDTIAAPGIRKTILLSTSNYTKLMNTPARVSFAMARMKPDESQFNQSFKPVAVLLEGKFQSCFKGRLPYSIDTSKLIGFKPVGDSTAMIVVSDGDVIRNEVRHSDNAVYPLGFDIYTEQQFANKEFIINCMNYLTGDGALLNTRTKQLKLRLLDTGKLVAHKLQWQLINMLLPLAIIFVLGIILAMMRKQKYAN